MALDDVSHGVLGAGAVHDLLRHVVRVRDEGPRDIAEVATLGQFLDGFTQFKLAILVGDGVSVGGREGGAAGLARGAPALAFYPRGVVRVDLVANGPW